MDGNPPSPRENHGFSTMKDGRLYVFGGFGPNSKQQPAATAQLDTNGLTPPKLSRAWWQCAFVYLLGPRDGRSGAVGCGATFARSARAFPVSVAPWHGWRPEDARAKPHGFPEPTHPIHPRSHKRMVTVCSALRRHAQRPASLRPRPQRLDGPVRRCRGKPSGRQIPARLHISGGSPLRVRRLGQELREIERPPLVRPRRAGLERPVQLCPGEPSGGEIRPRLRICGGQALRPWWL